MAFQVPAAGDRITFDPDQLLNSERSYLGFCIGTTSRSQAEPIPCLPTGQLHNVG
jgi:hypothetical protein